MASTKQVALITSEREHRVVVLGNGMRATSRVQWFGTTHFGDIAFETMEERMQQWRCWRHGKVTTIKGQCIPVSSVLSESMNVSILVTCKADQGVCHDRLVGVCTERKKE